MTGYLSCQIFLITFVNWPDKDLRPVSDSDIQQNRKKIGAQLIGIGVTRCRYLDAFPYSKQISSLNQSEIKGSVKIVLTENKCVSVLSKKFACRNGLECQQLSLDN